MLAQPRTGDSSGRGGGGVATSACSSHAARPSGWSQTRWATAAPRSPTRTRSSTGRVPEHAITATVPAPDKMRASSGAARVGGTFTHTA